MDKDMFDEELTQLTTRKGLFLRGGAAAAGLTVLGSPTAAAAPPLRNNPLRVVSWLSSSSNMSLSMPLLSPVG